MSIPLFLSMVDSIILTGSTARQSANALYSQPLLEWPATCITT
jgi:predicted amidophosphoribosyltransferase